MNSINNSGAMALTNDAGAVTTRYRHEPFGETSATGTASDNPFQFTGRENDGHDLYYYRARYYHPRLHRFLSEDPLDVSEVILRGQAGQTDGSDSQDVSVLRATLLSHPQFLNHYTYALNNPVNFTDPTGEIIPQVLGCALGGGISIGLDVLAGRKVNLLDAGLGCAAGTVGGFAYGKSFQFGLHDPHHYFPSFGKNLPHVQVNWWQKGVSGSGKGNVVRIPIPPSMYRFFKP